MQPVTVFLVLYSVINNTLYVNYPRYTEKCFITYNLKNATLDERWPQGWKEMKKQDDSCAISAVGNEDFIFFKVRYLLSNKYYTYINKLHIVPINSTALNNDLLSIKSNLSVYKTTTVLLGICCLGFTSLIIIFYYWYFVTMRKY